MQRLAHPGTLSSPSPSLGGTSADAQEKGKTGVTLGYPASIGLLWHVTDRIAIRPEFSFAFTSNDVTTTPHPPAGGERHRCSHRHRHNGRGRGSERPLLSEESGQPEHVREPKVCLHTDTNDERVLDGPAWLVVLERIELCRVRVVRRPVRADPEHQSVRRGRDRVHRYQQLLFAVSAERLSVQHARRHRHHLVTSRGPPEGGPCATR